MNFFKKNSHTIEPSTSVNEMFAMITNKLPEISFFMSIDNSYLLKKLEYQGVKLNAICRILCNDSDLKHIIVVDAGIGFGDGITYIFFIGKDFVFKICFMGAYNNIRQLRKRVTDLSDILDKSIMHHIGIAATNKSLIKYLGRDCGETVANVSIDPETPQNEKTIEIIHQNKQGLYSERATLDRKDDKFEFQQLYNDDFLPVHENIVDTITKTPSGITLLYGDPGTGKTSYIRMLMKKITSKKFVYMPPFMASQIGTPAFMNFLTNNKNKIYVIEDAENALKTRDAGGNEAVANILNASDGILGDVLNVHFICTFNCQVDEIDDALLRPGRLVDRYEFKKLTSDKTRVLWKAVTETDIPPNKEMTVAEIFHNNKSINPKIEETKQSVGFY